MDVGLIRKLAARAAGERAFADLTREDDTSLDQVLLQKAASAEDPDLFRIAMRMLGEPMKNYEALGGQYKVASLDPALEPTEPAEPPSRMGLLNNVSRGALTGGAIGGLLPLAAGLGSAVATGKATVPLRHMGVGAGLGALTGAGAAYLSNAKRQAEEQAAEDEVLKQAFGQPMFSAAPAPDPKLEAASLSSPSPSSSGPTGPKAPSASSGPSGGGSSAGSPKVQSVPEPSVPGAGVSAGAGGGMG